MNSAVKTHSAEIESGERFAFGKNWAHFLRVLNENRIQQAEISLRQMLEVEDLRGQSFLDIGCGSGLFSLAARRLGARVHSLDFDPNSVGCTMELRRRFSPDSEQWLVEEASALDTGHIRGLGQFDVVYSWGVLHHTGNMWLGLENAQIPVKPGGRLFIAIYNDTGTQARRWHWIKKTYNRLPAMFRVPFAIAVSAPAEVKTIIRSLLEGKPGEYIRSWTSYDDKRGMHRWYDVIDWVGGYPYEVATPEQIFDFYRARGFMLTKMICGGVGLGCNQFVFVRTSGPTPSKV
jgi:2-polyprenyl-6-hydroxyphenyl methylase/3-demethylubiquinone-9 3-methyltransferase